MIFFFTSYPRLPIGSLWCMVLQRKILIQGGGKSSLEGVALWIQINSLSFAAMFLEVATALRAF